MARLRKFNNVAVGRWKFESYLHFFDLEVWDEGIVGLYMWQQTDFRFPVLSFLVSDLPKRLKHRSLSPEEKGKTNEESFFIPWKSIQGVVTHDDHKELKIRTPEEIFTILFRYKQDYHKFFEFVKDKVGDQIFSRDNKKINWSIYDGRDVPKEKVILR